ncbi:HAD family hydrolase [Ornatilinea apprima]|uniref:HAD family hydrolase n=1 Tax=Ornatilinea apprima TaxID=1134406 RepID=A0A0P6XUE3_9CHLR|nr:HAD-IIA family hydrolase [Ornatilinea apprima]KPL78766.1 HAD family hydrolase [Ornatilinea apprima]
MNFEKLKKIRCYLLDMDGTIFLGGKLLPGAADFLELLRQRGIPFYFLTNNSSRSKIEYANKLSHLGIQAPENQIFTSGEATAIFINKQKPGARIFVVGTQPLEAEMRNHGFHLVEEQPDFVVLGFDTTLTYNKLWKLCDFVRAGVPYIATHPDYNCPTETGFMPDIGAMIAFVEASTGKCPDYIIGKPNLPVVEAMVEKTGYDVKELGMIGDRLYTDIALGRAGLTTVLVLSGETKSQDLLSSEFTPDYVMENLAELVEVYKSL